MLGSRPPTNEPYPSPLRPGSTPTPLTAAGRRPAQRRHTPRPRAGRSHSAILATTAEPALPALVRRSGRRPRDRAVPPASPEPAASLLRRERFTLSSPRHFFRLSCEVAPPGPDCATARPRRGASAAGGAVRGGGAEPGSGERGACAPRDPGKGPEPPSRRHLTMRERRRTPRGGRENRSAPRGGPRAPGKPHPPRPGRAGARRGRTQAAGPSAGRPPAGGVRRRRPRPGGAKGERTGRSRRAVWRSASMMKRQKIKTKNQTKKNGEKRGRGAGRSPC